MGREPLEPRRFRGTGKGWFEDEIIEMIQLTIDNFMAVQAWLEDNDSEAHLWTNESYVIGLWVHNTWHDGSGKTPMPFGWWVYRSPHSGRTGVASDVALAEHYTPC